MSRNSMSRNLSRLFASRMKRYALSIALALSCSSAIAQSGDAMLEFYGEGVHRFFAGDLVGAEEILTRVIDSGSQDARAYYFRGLVREQQGGGGEFDFETGARLELESKRSVNVGLALTRIQGHVRGKIEKARREARAMVAQQRMMMQQSRMEAAGNPGVPVPESLPVAPDTRDADMFDEGL